MDIFRAPLSPASLRVRGEQGVEVDLDGSAGDGDGDVYETQPPGRGVSDAVDVHDATRRLMAGLANGQVARADSLAVLAEEFELRTGVVINEENILLRLWRIAALSNVVRLTRNDDK